MENSVSAAPLLVRKGITYTKLAVTQAGRKGAVLHLGTGKGERGFRAKLTGHACKLNPTFVRADRGELHRVAVVGQNTTLLQEIPLFPSQEPINNILLHQVEHWHTTTLSYVHACAVHTRVGYVSPGSGSGGQPPASGPSLR